MKAARFLMWSFLAVLLAASVAWFGFPRQTGMLEAQYDLWRGKREVRWFGLPPFIPDAEEIALRRVHGYRYRMVAGCVVNDFIIENVKGYNEVMKGAVKVTAGQPGKS